MNQKKERFTLAYENSDWWAVRDGDITLWKEEVIVELNKLDKEVKDLTRLCEVYSDFLISQGYDLSSIITASGE